MECKDCENYKPKEDSKFQEMAKKINELTNDYCKINGCNKCLLNNNEDKCIGIIIDHMLNQRVTDL